MYSGGHIGPPLQLNDRLNLDLTTLFTYLLACFNYSDYFDSLPTLYLPWFTVCLCMYLYAS